MNAWHDSAIYAARDRIERYRQEARYSGLLRAAAPWRRRALPAWRHRAAAALHRLADGLAPQPEPGRGGGMGAVLDPSRGRPLG